MRILICLVILIAALQPIASAAQHQQGWLKGMAEQVAGVANPQNWDVLDPGQPEGQPGRSINWPMSYVFMFWVNKVQPAPS